MIFPRANLGRLLSKRFFSTIIEPPPAVPNSVILIKSQNPTPINLDIDTWHWVSTLSKTNLSTSQSEALLSCCQLIISHRLSQWLPTLVSLPRLQHDSHLLRTMAHEQLRSQPPAKDGTVLQELHLAAEEMKDGTVGVRTEVGVRLAEYKAEGREEGQRWEMDLHRLTGKLDAGMAAFRSEAENVKVKTMYSFAMVIFSMLLIAVVDRSTSRKGSKDEKVNQELNPLELSIL